MQGGVEAIVRSKAGAAEVLLSDAAMTTSKSNNCRNHIKLKKYLHYVEEH